MWLWFQPVDQRVAGSIPDSANFLKVRLERVVWRPFRMHIVCLIYELSYIFQINFILGCIENSRLSGGSLFLSFQLVEQGFFRPNPMTGSHSYGLLVYTRSAVRTQSERSQAEEKCTENSVQVWTLAQKRRERETTEFCARSSMNVATNNYRTIESVVLDQMRPGTPEPVT